ncbi:hypothetical protein NE848_04420 [Gramella jeungdoensis]|uniref:Uncharacterized protein n=1 Tax=Gramella jeungdoensis TaxID=708091 RepID=A0ABT0YYR7_9FLAO|nr:hypothetical protein [Gramella jeungdoensis]MCM8568610.1 hypothetical protein [Gramella jeungdoensis]
MRRTMKTSRVKEGRPLSWTVMGALIAPLALITFSYVQADEELRMTPVLVIITIVGAIAGRIAFLVQQSARVEGWKRSGLLVLGLLMYGLVVLLGFFIARLA